MRNSWGTNPFLTRYLFTGNDRDQALIVKSVQGGSSFEGQVSPGSRLLSVNGMDVKTIDALISVFSIDKNQKTWSFGFDERIVNVSTKQLIDDDIRFDLTHPGHDDHRQSVQLLRALNTSAYVSFLHAVAIDHLLRSKYTSHP